MSSLARLSSPSGASSTQRRIYQMWQANHRHRHATYVLGLCVYVMLLMIFFDQLFVRDAVPFAWARVVALFVLLPSLYLNRRFAKRPSSRSTKSSLQSFLLLTGPLVCHIQYFYFVFVLQHEKVLVYFTGLLMVVFYGSFVLHKFRREHYIFGFFGILSTIPFAFIYPERADLAYITIVSHLVAAFIFLYFRRDFVANLDAIFNLVRMMVPARVAEILAISQGTAEATNLSKPDQRFVVCLCADWRNFQQITQLYSNDEVSMMLERFYDSVLDGLDRLVPSNNYYFNWTADELFVIFFAEADESNEILRNALNFSKLLATEIFRNAQKHPSFEICFDIGMACGMGLLGLQGPKHMKKTTITGEVAGRSKRLQNEAKRLRRVLDSSGPPIVVIDERLRTYSEENGIFPQGELQEIRAQTKDIRNLLCYYWVDKEAIVASLKSAS